MVLFLLLTIKIVFFAAVKSPSSKSGTRLLFGIWLVFCLILDNVYKGNLKAMLILPKRTLPFNNLDEFLDTGITPLISKNSALEQTILVRNIYAFHLNTDLISNFDSEYLFLEK